MLLYSITAPLYGTSLSILLTCHPRASRRRRIRPPLPQVDARGPSPQPPPLPATAAAANCRHRRGGPGIRCSHGEWRCCGAAVDPHLDAPPEMHARPILLSCVAPCARTPFDTPSGGAPPSPARGAWGVWADASRPWRPCDRCSAPSPAAAAHPPPPP